MYGTSCQDITLTNDLIEYFDLDIVDVQDSFISIMNKDPILDTENVFQHYFGFKKQITDSSMSEVIQSSMGYTTWRKSLATNEDLQADQIDSISLEKGKARLYNDETLNYGELQTIDDSGNKKSFFYVLVSLNVEMYERSISETEKLSVDSSKGKVADWQRNYEIAFFSESSELLETIRTTKESLVNEIFKLLVFVVASISLICLVLFIFIIRSMSFKMTKQIIYFYETLESILEQKDSKVELSYKPSS